MGVVFTTKKAVVAKARRMAASTWFASIHGERYSHVATVAASAMVATLKATCSRLGLRS